MHQLDHPRACIRGHAAAMKSHGLRLRGKQTVAARPAMAALARVPPFVEGARMPSLAARPDARPDAKAAKAAAPTSASTPCAGGGPRFEGGCRGPAWMGRPFATSAVGDDALDGEKERRAIVEKHFNVSWSELGWDARANLFYYLVDHGKVDGGMAAPETTEEGCMPPPSPADSEATLHLPTHDSTLAAPCGPEAYQLGEDQGSGYADETRQNAKRQRGAGRETVQVLREFGH